MDRSELIHFNSPAMVRQDLKKTPNKHNLLNFDSTDKNAFICCCCI